MIKNQIFVHYILINFVEFKFSSLSLGDQDVLFVLLSY